MATNRCIGKPRNKRSSNAITRATACAFEALEDRQMFTTMTVTGTAAGDIISLSVSGPLVTATVNGTPTAQLDSIVTDVVINAGGGADTINIVSNGNNSVVINAGAGDDTINIASTSHDLDDITDVIAVNGDADNDNTNFHDWDHVAAAAYNFNSGNTLSRTGMSAVTWNTEAGSLGAGLAGDTININAPFANPFAIDGNSGFDFLVLSGSGSESATYTPSATQPLAGIVNHAGTGIGFINTDRVIGGNLSSLTLVTPNPGDNLTMTNPIGVTNRIVGTSGGVAIAELSFQDVPSVTLDLATNDGAGGSDILNLTDGTVGTNLLKVINGNAHNAINVSAGAYSLDTDLGATLGNTTDVTITGGTVTFSGSQHLDGLALRDNGTAKFTGSGSVLTVQDLSVTSNVGNFDLTNVQSATVANSFSVGAGLTFNKKGAGTLSFQSSVTHSHGTGSFYTGLGGTTNFASDLGTAAARRINVGAQSSTVNFSTTQHVASVFAGTSGHVVMQPNGSRVLVTGDIFVETDGAGGDINLNNNDLILDYIAATQLPVVQSMINNGRAGGFWNGAGLISTNALTPPKITTLGAMEATSFKNFYGAAAKFDNETIDDTAVLVKYTYYGDTDFNGKVDGADYARIDSAFNSQANLGNIGGWINGDSDANGRVDGADYALIDAAFNGQGSVVLRTDAGSSVGSGRSVFSGASSSGLR